MVERARIVPRRWQTASAQRDRPAASDRPAGEQVADALRRDRLVGLVDAPRPGAAARYDESTERRILAASTRRPRAGMATWTGSLLATTLGDVSRTRYADPATPRISLRRRRSWCLSTDPAFAAKARRHRRALSRPTRERARPVRRREARDSGLERSQGWLRLPDGRALTGFAHEYKRHGTTTLFAAWKVASGLIQTATTPVAGGASSRLHERRPRGPS